ncbi:MAG: uroporphyrinogen decarboxylase [Myxococcales bacterium]|nr:MAG: uroporphyrinogen decarboxylase [Myxococcales bacterium]
MPEITSGFGGLRVVSFESRMARETARLVARAGGIPISAPSMREVPLDEHGEAHAFADELLAADFDIVIFLTGVGTQLLFSAMETRHERATLVSALSRTTVVARGPKPVKALRKLGVPITITVPEPNTWRDLIATLDESAESVAVEGARVAIQEYGVSNPRLLDALAERGARVRSIPVYRWALPEDRRPLLDAIREIIARTTDIALFTSATQVHHVLAAADEAKLGKQLRDAFGEVVIASIGPVCSEALQEAGLGTDLEPSRPKLGVFVREIAEHAADLVTRKRSRLRTAAVGRHATVRGADPNAGVFMRACRGEATEHTPVWLMRQAGRYMQEYREIRARVPFIELCKNPELAAEVTITAQERIGADAAILFSDILLILEPIGLGLDYLRGEGPSISHVVRGARDVDRLCEVKPEESLTFVFEAVRRIRAGLSPGIPLIGFSGAPFTLASYAIEGGGSRNYVETKKLMYGDEGAWHAMMALLARAVGEYLRYQIDAGCQAVQLFDSWVGCLSPADYERYVLRHTRAVVDALPDGVPLIHFGTDTATLLELQAEAGASVIGVDHRMRIGEAFERFPNLAVQGNLDPVVLMADREVVRTRTLELLDEVGGRPGHIFNLGHGILPATPVDNVIALVDTVHEASAARVTKS